MSFIGLQRLAILKVSRDEIGRYVKFKANLSDGTLEFRCELDAQTYKHLRKAVDTKYFDSLATEYHYDLILTYQRNEMVDSDSTGLPFKGVIRCTQGDRAIQMEFPCSERFAGNMEWFRKEVKSIEDIQHLAWANFS